MENFIMKNKLENLEKSKNSDGDEIIHEILESVNKFISCEDLKSATFYINIANLFKMTDFTTKVSILILDSIVKFKTKNHDGLLKITRKVIKYLSKNSTNYSHEIISLFIKILFKTAQAHEENENLFIPCWFYYLAKNLNDGTETNRENSTQTIIKSKIHLFLRKITEKVN